jgi:hypothetical protein
VLCHKRALPKQRRQVQHDQAPTHCALNVKQFIASKSICVIQQPPPPSSSDLALAHFLFSYRLNWP